MRVCTRCLESKEITEFNRLKRGPEGLHRRCRACLKETQRDARIRQNIARNAKYFENHEDSKRKQREYQSANRGKFRKACRDWRNRNPLMMKVLKDIWDAANADKNAASAKRYYTRKRNRCPKWLSASDHKKIEKFYAAAKFLTEQSGVKHCVDHVVPLHGELVSGLHVPWNLQVLTLSENSSKGNRFVGGF